MQADIHPKYKDVVITCSCGNTFETRSTLKQDVLRVDVCSACHPFYTGKHRGAATAGRVDRFNRRYGVKTEAPATGESAAE